RPHHAAPEGPHLKVRYGSLGWNGIFVGLAETMQVTETLSDGLKRNYTVVLPVADLESRRTERLTTLGKTLRLPGFRPGKVPMPIVKQRFGNAVSAEVLEESVSEATRKVLSERG